MIPPFSYGSARVALKIPPSAKKGSCLFNEAVDWVTSWPVSYSRESLVCAITVK